MFPILVIVYVRLAKYEEGIAAAEFGQAYEEYRNTTPAFIPHIVRS
jgi:protein-S-isoprenylcysteine O-methyltransferase Ste14